MYKTNEFIYPDIVKRNFQCTKSEVKSICERRIGKDITRIDMLKCPNCYKYIPIGSYLPRSKEEPDIEWYCPVCDYKMNEDNITILYKKG